MHYLDLVFCKYRSQQSCAAPRGRAARGGAMDAVGEALFVNGGEVVRLVVQIIDVAVSEATVRQVNLAVEHDGVVDIGFLRPL